MLEVGRANKGLKRQIGNWAKSTGLQYNRAMMKCSTVSMWPEMKYKIADRMVFQVYFNIFTEILFLNKANN